MPSDIPLTVTASPAKGLDATLELTEKLVGHGYSVVPHLAARMISGQSELAEIVDRLQGARHRQRLRARGRPGPARR